MKPKLIVLTILLTAATLTAAPFDRSVRGAPNFEPTIPRAEQDKSVAAKLKAHGATFKKFPPKDVGLGM